MTEIAIAALKEGRKVFSNYYDDAFQGTKVVQVDIDELIAKPVRPDRCEAVLMVAEAETVVPARYTKITTYRVNWLTSAYKRGFDVVYETPNPRKVDKRLREATSSLLKVGEVQPLRRWRTQRLKGRLAR